LISFIVHLFLENGYINDCPSLVFSSSQTTILRLEKSGFGVRSVMGGFDEHTPQPLAAFAGFTTETFAATPLVARIHTR
jgi:hypothetical protein